MKQIIRLSILCLAVLFSACSNDDNEVNEIVPASGPLFEHGQIVTSEFLKGDEVIESMVDTVINLGSDKHPALFYINSSHKVLGEQIDDGNTQYSTFRSLKREHLKDFIKLWGELHGFDINHSAVSEEAKKEIRDAYIHLNNYVRANELDLPLFIALCKDVMDTEAAIEIVAASTPSSAMYSTAKIINTSDNILNTLETTGIRPSELAEVLQSEDLSIADYLSLANQTGIDVATNLKSAKIAGILAAELILAGTVIASEAVVAFIEHNEPVIDFEGSYVSYLHPDDINPMHYANSKTMTSNDYSVKYCSLAKATFYMETVYNSGHQTIPGQYIARAGMIAKSVKVGWGMHVNAQTKFEAAQPYGTEENPIAKASGTVDIKYGECCAFSRKAKLKFTLSGDKGFEQDSWNAKVKK